MFKPDAVIFDLDGLLIDSEPFWHIAEINVFKTVGIELTVENCLETTGWRVDDMIALRYQQKPWDNKSIQQVEDEIIDEVIHQISTNGVAKDGVYPLIQFFEEANIPMAVASSSAFRIIEAAIEKLEIKSKLKLIHSAEKEPLAKPHPGVYLTTADLLKTDPQKCLAFEDSKTGLIAAKAARMKTVAVPEIYEPAFEMADLVLKSLVEFNLSAIKS